MNENSYWEILSNIITLDLNLRGVVNELDRVLKQLKGREYLKNVCSRVSSRLDYGSEVFIFTGFPIPPLYRFESDGPIGAIVLARALLHLNAKPLIIVERNLLRVIVRLALSLKLRVNVGGTVSKGVGVLGVNPSGEGEEQILRLLSHFHPSIAIFIEKPGQSINGRYYTMRLEDISNYVFKVDQIIPLTSKLSILTVGIGDGGNEVGMGILYKLSPRVITVTRTDELIVSTISNWGVYALVAGLSFIRGVIDILHKPEYEELLIREATKLGLIDGILRCKSFSVDSCPLNINKHIVGLLRNYTIRYIRC